MPRYRLWRDRARAFAQVTAPFVSRATNRVLDGIVWGMEQVPDIVWDMEAEQRADLQRYAAAGISLGAATTLISENTPSETSLGKRAFRGRGSIETGSSGLVHPPVRPVKRLRSNILHQPSPEWLRISSSSGSAFSNNQVVTPPSQRGSTQPFSQYSQKLRRDAVLVPWLRRKKKVLSWFRTRLLLRSRARKRRKQSIGYRNRQGLIALARHVDRIQRKYRKVNRTNTAYGRHLLQRLARGKKKLWFYRRRYRRHGLQKIISR